MSEYLSFKLPDYFIERYEEIKPEWGFPVGGGNSLAEVTLISKYSRKKSDGTKERWHEICRRCVEGSYTIMKNHCFKNRTYWNENKAQKAAQDAFDRMFTFKWSPPGRGMQFMGTDLVHEFENSSVLYNCAFLSTEKLTHHSVYSATHPFVRLMEMSIHGIGVGFDTRGADKLEIDEPFGELVEYVIPDTREGWCESTGALLESYFFKNRSPISFDYSEIRPAGAPIKRFGGIAPGPDPLIRLHENIRNLFKGRSGEKVASTDIVDLMNMIGMAVVAGGLRRSALIALGDSNDKPYINLKNTEINPERMADDGTGWGWTSNNSIIANTQERYDGEVASLIADNGEPGLIYLDMIRKYGRLVDASNNKDQKVGGVNPCLTGDTWILTDNGPKQISDILGEKVKVIVNGETYSTTDDGFFCTDEKKVMILNVDGTDLKVTDDHQILTPKGWVKARDIKLKDKVIVNNNESFYDWPAIGTWEEGYIIGSLVGDGTYENDTNAKLCVWDEDESSVDIMNTISKCIEKLNLHHRSDWNGWNKTSFGYRLSSAPIAKMASFYGVTRQNKQISYQLMNTSSEMFKGFLSGIFDADGHVEGESTKGGVSIRLSSSKPEMLSNVKIMLSALGVRSVVRSMHGDDHDCMGYKAKECFRLIISGVDVERFINRIGFNSNVKQEKASSRTRAMTRGFYEKESVGTIQSISEGEITFVYDAYVPGINRFDANTVIVHNCGEIGLESEELCNLVEVYPTHIEDIDDLKATLKHAYMYAKSVTLLTTEWQETNEVINRNRRLGISMTGLAEFVENKSWVEAKNWMDSGYKYLFGIDKVYSEWLGVRESIKLTAVKPSGSVSLVFATTPGAHWPVSEKYYIRRIRYSINDPFVEILRKAGYHVEPDVKDPETTLIVEFPTQGPNVRSEKQVSIWEKAELAALAQKWWADNAVSVTVTFREDEKQDIGALIQSKTGNLKTLSMMPIYESGGAYKQMPYEDIDEERYDQLIAKVKPINMNKVYAGDALDIEVDNFCTTDKCEIDFVNMK